MPPKWVHEIIPAVAMLVGVALGAFLIQRRGPKSLATRRTRKRSWLFLALMAFFCAMAISKAWESRFSQHKVMLAAGVACVAIALYQCLRKPPAHEAMENFAADSRHCGQCEYDLTGNTSGVCPECGWRIPQGELDIDTPGWALWWQQWPIDHLRNWRKTLADLIIFAVLFAAAAVVEGVYFKSLAVVPLMAFMSVHMLVNAIRVVAYGRRQAGR
ncbi:MAG TPA: hypothetical protein VHP11_14880 [Tepidisphaeraceae bacterium]|nr:hypothetical protein [Tepidisphaeraceae bacterium]